MSIEDGKPLILEPMGDKMERIPGLKARLSRGTAQASRDKKDIPVTLTKAPWEQDEAAE